MNETPKVGIIVLNYNGKDVLQNCLQSLSICDYGNFEVIVVDNASGDGSFEKAKQIFPQFIFLQNNENLGFAKGNNIGIRHALEIGCEYVLLLNNDTEVKSDFLKELVLVAKNRPEIGLFSSLIFKGKTDHIWFSGGKIDWFRMKTKHWTDRFSQAFRQSNFITGCALFVKREVFEKIGLLDEDYFLYWEDADFCCRARRSGFETAVCSKSNINHFEISENTSENKLYWLVFSGLLFFRKNAPLHLRPWLYCYTFIRKTKNWLDRRNTSNKSAKIVYKAYKDFKNVK